MDQYLLREDALVTGILDGEFYIVTTSSESKYLGDLFVLTYTNGKIIFDQGWYQNSNILALRYNSIYPDGRGYISTYIEGIIVVLKYSFEEGIFSISYVPLEEIDDKCIINPHQTVMPTDGMGLYSWVPLMFGQNDKVNIYARNSEETFRGFPIPKCTENILVNGYVSPVPITWFSKYGVRITDDALIYNYCFRRNKLNMEGILCQDYYKEGIEGITNFGDGYNSNFTPFYTSSSCGDKWNKKHKNTFDQDIFVDDGKGYGMSSIKPDICAFVEGDFIDIPYPALLVERAEEKIEEVGNIVEGYIANNRNNILNFIGDNIFALFPNICEYINSDGKCRRSICSQCNERNCPESFRNCPGGCGPPYTGGAAIWAIWIISILAFAFIVATVFGIIGLIYYNREAREVERLRYESIGGIGIN